MQLHPAHLALHKLQELGFASIIVLGHQSWADSAGASFEH